MRVPPNPGRIPLRPLYSIAELARATRIERGRLHRMLDERGIELFFVSGRPCVPLSEIVTKLKPLWDSVQAFEALESEDDSDEDCFE
jgi:hypothetical protein